MHEDQDATGKGFVAPPSGGLNLVKRLSVVSACIVMPYKHVGRVRTLRYD